MNIHNEPLVSVVTPVYNGGEFLEECIESVLGQTYQNYEYIIVNNCSTDATLDIAQRCARKDSRIRIHNNSSFLDIISSHNNALRLMSYDSKYCKVVSADDVLFPDCISKMVELAETDPTISIVGSYQLTGGGDKWEMRCVGLPYWRTIISGEEMCRLHLLTCPGILGAPTTSLYRSALVRDNRDFFPNMRPEADISACIKHLRNMNYGFVHAVLSYERRHSEQATTTEKSLNAYMSSNILDLIEYGPEYLTAEEQKHRLAELFDQYYKVMAVACVNLRDRAYWKFQMERLSETGHQLNYIKLAKAVCVKLLDLLLCPKETWQRVAKRIGSGKHSSKRLSVLSAHDAVAE